jgi:hypothetical protein
LIGGFLDSIGSTDDGGGGGGTASHRRIKNQESKIKND